MKYNYSLAISAKILNCLLFAVMTLLTLHSANFLPVEQVLFFRSIIGIIIIIAYLLIIKQPIKFNLSKKNLLFYICRSLSSFAAMLIWIYAIKHIGVTEATAISYTGPFWIFIAAKFIVGEAFDAKGLLAIFINMLGVIIVLHPSIESISFIGVGASISSILLWVLYETICKKQTSDQHYMLQSFYTYFFAIIISAPFALMKWQPIEFEMINSLFWLSFLSVANVTSIFIAYKYAPMMVISPFSYARLLFTAILTNIFYNTMPHVEVFIGAAVILCANLWFAYHSFKRQQVLPKETII